MAAIRTQLATFTSIGTKKSVGEWRAIQIGRLAVTPVFYDPLNGSGAPANRCILRSSLLRSSTIQAFAPEDKLESKRIHQLLIKKNRGEPRISTVVWSVNTMMLRN